MSSSGGGKKRAARPATSVDDDDDDHDEGSQSGRGRQASPSSASGARGGAGGASAGARASSSLLLTDAVGIDIGAATSGTSGLASACLGPNPPAGAPHPRDLDVFIKSTGLGLGMGGNANRDKHSTMVLIKRGAGTAELLASAPGLLFRVGNAAERTFRDHLEGNLAKPGQQNGWELYDSFKPLLHAQRVGAAAAAPNLGDTEVDERFPSAGQPRAHRKLVLLMALVMKGLQNDMEGRVSAEGSKLAGRGTRRAFVISVPIQWDLAAQMLMERAAQMAGIAMSPDPAANELFFLPEPHAALLGGLTYAQVCK